MALLGQAGLGVSVFFVLSGYLITRLLLAELRENSFISLRAFYARRVFRIFPALYVYCFAMVGLVLAGRISIPPTHFLSVLTFTWNYSSFGRVDWWLGHCWSLSVEEQFYLVWPLILVLSGPHRAKRVAIFVIAIEPIVRTVTYAVCPSVRPEIGIMGHTRIDTILFGCLLALLEVDASAGAWLKKISGSMAFGAVGVLVGHCVLERLFQGAWRLPFGYSVEGAAIVVLISWAVRAGDVLPARILRAAPVTWLGRVSYSLYLWQQAFLAHEGWAPLTFPANLLGALGAASASYYLVEQPVLRLRRRRLVRLSGEVVSAEE